MNLLTITFPLSALLIFVMAIGLGIALTRRFGLGWRLYWIGGAVFVLSQVFHIPFNLYGLPAIARVSLLPAPSLPWALPFQGLVLGLSAGIFEEVARLLMYRFWAKDARSWNKGLLAGAGHGGMEAMIIGALIFYSYLQIMALREVDLSLLFPSGQLEIARQQIEQFWSMSWYDSLLGAVERALAIPLHMALSVLVLQVFQRRQIRWLFFAITWHAAANAVAAVYVFHTYGMWEAELVFGLFTLGSIAIILALRRPEPRENLGTMPEPLEPYVIRPVEESGDQIDDSRFILRDYKGEQE
jgi:uncharacterized membrane protein YhfC